MWMVVVVELWNERNGRKGMKSRRNNGTRKFNGNTPDHIKECLSLKR